MTHVQMMSFARVTTIVTPSGRSTCTGMCASQRRNRAKNAPTTVSVKTKQSAQELIRANSTPASIGSVCPTAIHQETPGCASMDIEPMTGSAQLLSRFPSGSAMLAPTAATALQSWTSRTLSLNKPFLASAAYFRTRPTVSGSTRKPMSWSTPSPRGFISQVPAATESTWPTIY